MPPHRARAALALALAGALAAHAQPLPRLVLDANATTVSGISSGAFMAVQFEFIHSATVRGAGVVAGGPFHCAADGNFLTYALCCQIASTINVTALAAYAAQLAAAGLIDPLAGLRSHTVHLFSGTIDSFVSHGTMLALADLYARLGVPTTATFNVSAEHAWITSKYGNPCATLAAPFVSNCGIDFAGDFLRATATGPWNATPGAYTPSNMLNFSQAAFGANANLSLDTLGYIYVPQPCAAGARCRLHVNFHGCDQARSELGDTYVSQTQLNEWAESNHVVVLYPQATWNLNEGNVLACWDTYGYLTDDANYCTKSAPQVSIVKAMVDALLGAGA